LSHPQNGNLPEVQMADSPAQEQISKMEGVNLAVLAPVSDAMATLLNEGRQGAYSINGTVDTTNPKNVELKTDLTERNSEGNIAHPQHVLHGLDSTTVDLSGADSGIAKVSNAMVFIDGKGDPVRFSDLSVSTNAVDNTSSMQFDYRDAAGKTIFQGVGVGNFHMNADSLRSLTLEQIVDASGKSHTALEFSSSSADNSKQVADTFVFKDGITPQQALEKAIEIPANMLGVIHSQISTNGDKSTFSVDIQPARNIAPPSLNFGTQK